MTVMTGDIATDQSPGGPPGMRAVFEQIEAQLQLTGDRWAARDYTTDGRLAWLSGQVGRVADNSLCERSLLRVAAITVAWLEAMGMPVAIVRTSLAEERGRQWRRLADKNTSFAADAPAPECGHKLRALLKALGRVAHAVEGVEIAPCGAIAHNGLAAELVLVAAVAVVWLEEIKAGMERENIKTENIA